MLKSKRLWRNLIIAALLLIIAAVSYGALWVSNQNIDKLANPLPKPTVIYDVYGKAASTLSASPIVPVALKDISMNMQHAIIAVEDKRFYEHGGVDLSALGRALFKNAASGGVVEGGSTITQQLAKNIFLSSEKTYSRKLKEAAIAVKIEREYDKDKILELYLNQIYFGEGSWGVQKAARAYFGKKASDLSLPEAALLAAMPKAPSHYSPITHKQEALQRRNLVLSLMKEQGYVTGAEYEKAKAAPIELHRGTQDALSGQYPSYVDYVLEEATEKYDLTEKELLTGGYRIYTGLDPKVQKGMEQVYANAANFPQSPDKTLVQSGAVVTDPFTGEVRGLVGSRGGKVFRGWNRAYQIKRQPGSAFKPLAVYGPALEKGYKPDSTLHDEPLNIDGYAPTNAGGGYHGDVSLREALVHSYNVPAVWLLNEIGVGTGMDYVHKAGINLTKQDRNLSLALGGLSEGVSPLQMAQAYGAFANKGIMNQAHAINKITAKDGTVIASVDPQETQVFKKETAYQMTKLLEGVVKEGTGKRAGLDRPAAGKTGTTQLPNTKEFTGLNGSKDAWFVGYTPELVAAVWMGYDITDKAHYMTASGGTYPAALFKQIMTRALAGVPVNAFDIPGGFDAPPAPAAAPKQKRPDHSHVQRDKAEKKSSVPHEKGKEKHKPKSKGDKHH